MALPLLITQAEVRRLFDYDPSTGLLSWRVRTSTRVKVGDIVKCQHPQGYTQVGVHGHRCLVHHIVWLWVHGEVPSGDIDHINRDRADNSQEQVLPAPLDDYCQVKLKKAGLVSALG